MAILVSPLLGIPQPGNYDLTTGLYSRNCIIGILVVLISILQSVHASWLHLGLPSLYHAVTEEFVEELNHTNINLEFLEPTQKKLYGHDIRTLHAISKGAFMTIKECQEQFKHRRWNCPVYNKTNLFGPIVNLKTRETAFIHAISSAGVAYSVTKACASGELRQCGCDPNPRVPDRTNHMNGITWGGCFDDLGYGSRFSKKFLDSLEQRNTAQGSLNIWNYGAGRKALKDNMVVSCRCMGPTGGCHVKSCWKKMQSFRLTGNVLKEKFEEAHIVRWNEIDGTLERIGDNFRRPTKRDLVYLERSSNYCEFEPMYGSPGTRGRQCNKTSLGIDGCDLMCCGRGYRDVVDTVEIHCDCKFQWCCQLDCKTCLKQFRRSYCN